MLLVARPGVVPTRRLPEPTREEIPNIPSGRGVAAPEGDWDGYVLELYYSDLDTDALGYSAWLELFDGEHWFEAGWYYYHGDGRHYWFDADYYPHGYGYSYTTYYNQGLMDYMGAGDNDWARLLLHERAHQAGWNHGEGTEDTNGAYYDTVEITGT